MAVSINLKSDSLNLAATASSSAVIGGLSFGSSSSIIRAIFTGTRRVRKQQKKQPETDSTELVADLPSKTRLATFPA
jgi:hypothetical protein